MKPIAYTQLCILLMCGTQVVASPNLPRLLSHGAVPVGLEQGCFGTVISHSASGQTVSLPSAGRVVVPAGKSELSYKFQEAAQIRSIFFATNGISGVVSAYVSLDGNKWDKVAVKAIKNSDSHVKLDGFGKFGSNVRLQLDVLTKGEIFVPRVFTSACDADYSVSQTVEVSSMVDFASGVGGTRVIYSSSEKAISEAMGQGCEGFAFDSSKRKTHYLVYDLQQPRAISECVFVGGAGVGAITVLGGSTLPESEDWKGRLFLSVENLARMKTLATKKLVKADTCLSINSKETHRFVVVKMEAVEGTPLMKIGSLCIRGAAVVQKNSKTILAKSSQAILIQNDQNLQNSDAAQAQVAYQQPAPVFAWDLERSLSNNLMSNARLSEGLGGGGLTSFSTRGRRADGEEDPDPDPLGIEILRCDFVSEP